MFHEKKLDQKLIFLFRSNDAELLPIGESCRFTTRLTVDLLLLTDGSNYHYVLISDFQKLVKYVQHKVHRFKSEFWCKFFHTCASFETLRRHQKLWYQDEDFVITIPKPGKDDHRFKNLTARWYVPSVINFDLQSLLLPVYGPQPDPQQSSTKTIEIHQPCRYAWVVIELGKKEVKVWA